ncbi:N-acetyltransferase [Pseudomonas sp. CFBP 8758]|uniref:N-acetyltransferase n=1 Tax=Pseudomonas sp. CFBP 8758 TaxID=2775286 RepID=UPI00177CBBD7|nr:N-acetyltransferase [Pseudomonas sp. CFBP 8758]MBD8595630.1 N-acetyltransferase [Pseudomonas sp. CFBP 8758]
MVFLASVRYKKWISAESLCDFQVVLSLPNGGARITYGMVDFERVRAFVTYVSADPINGAPYFGVGYAVHGKFRRQCLASKILVKNIAEIKRRLARNGIQKIYIEAVVGESIISSRKVAEKVISAAPDRTGLDEFTESQHASL